MLERLSLEAALSSKLYKQPAAQLLGLDFLCSLSAPNSNYIHQLFSIYNRPSGLIPPPTTTKMKVQALLLVLATAAAASPLETRQAAECVKCAQYCSDPSNGVAIGAACYIVKCGIQVS